MKDKIKILFFADTHLGFDQPIRRATKRPRRGPDFFRNFHQVLAAAHIHKVDLVIHGGDLFDRSHVHPTILNRAYDALFQFAEEGIPIVLVPGNHDRSTLPSGLFLQHPNIKIFREPGTFTFQFKETRCILAGFPFIRNIGEALPRVLEKIAPGMTGDGIKILCMHQAVQGAVVGPAAYTFRPGPQVISMQDLTGPYHAYLSGHIHPHQILYTEGGIPFIYPGSIERTSFAEKDESKGYTLLTFLGDASKLEVDFKQLPSRPMHTILLEDTSTKNEVITTLYSNISSLPKNSIVRIESTTPEISRWIKEKAVLSSLPKEMIIQWRHSWLPKQYEKSTSKHDS